MVIAAVDEAADCLLVSALETPTATAIGQDTGILAGLAGNGVTISDDPAAVFAAADIVIDFTVPQATRAHAVLAAQTGTGLVSGTTGLVAEDRQVLSHAAQSVPLLWAPNMSLGVNTLLGLVTAAARSLPDTDIEIVEIHHRHKVDAPSGTALALGRAAADGRGVELEEVQNLSREGITGERQTGEIGFATLRGGDVAGEHTVILAADGERIELTHRATDRMIFARGAVQAAKWLNGKPAAQYGMADVLGLTD